MSQARPASGAAKRKLALMTDESFRRIVSTCRHAGQHNIRQQHPGNTQPLRRRQGDLIAIGETNLGGGHAVAARLLQLILGQAAMNDPGKNR